MELARCGRQCHPPSARVGGARDSVWPTYRLSCRQRSGRRRCLASAIPWQCTGKHDGCVGVANAHLVCELFWPWQGTGLCQWRSMTCVGMAPVDCDGGGDAGEWWGAMSGTNGVAPYTPVAWVQRRLGWCGEVGRWLRMCALGKGEKWKSGMPPGTQSGRVQRLCGVDEWGWGNNATIGCIHDTPRIRIVE